MADDEFNFQQYWCLFLLNNFITCRFFCILQSITITSIYLSKRPHFPWVCRRDNQRGIVGKHEESVLFKSFSSVLPTSQMGYHAGKPIETVVYCFYKITLSFL